MIKPLPIMSGKALGEHIRASYVTHPTESSSPCTLCLCKVLGKLVDAPNIIIKPFPNMFDKAPSKPIRASLDIHPTE
jgi:hypothetical protein